MRIKCMDFSRFFWRFLPLKAIHWMQPAAYGPIHMQLFGTVDIQVEPITNTLCVAVVVSLVLLLLYFSLLVYINTYYFVGSVFFSCFLFNFFPSSFLCCSNNVHFLPILWASISQRDPKIIHMCKPMNPFRFFRFCLSCFSLNGRFDAHNPGIPFVDNESRKFFLCFWFLCSISVQILPSVAANIYRIE